MRLKKFGYSLIRAYFWRRYENDNETYKEADQEDAPAAGRGLIVLYDKITRAFPNWGGSFL
jgi:hypothetical protein